MKLVFVFPGHGVQRWNMGRQLLEEEPLFRATIEECDRLARRHVPWSLLEELLADESHSRLEQRVDITQTALCAIQVALADLWRSRGVEPQAVVGYCMGEVAASYVAGTLSLADAIRVIVNRSRIYLKALGQGEGCGAMAWVNLPGNMAESYLEAYKDRLWLVAHNSPIVAMLSGDAAALEDVLKTLRSKRIAYGLMRTPGAGHTPQVEPLAQELVRSLEGLRPQPGSIPMFSTVTGELIQGTELGPEYWGRQLRNPILFAEALDCLIQAGYDLFVEVGAAPILSTPIRHCLDHRGKTGNILSSLCPPQEDRQAMLDSLWTLLLGGAVPEDRVSRAKEEFDRRARADRRTGFERRKLKLAEVVVIERFGKERRSGLDRRDGQERRVAVG
jgi:acyl transferase domain-containing protein